MAKYRKKPVVVDAFRWTVDVTPQWWRDRDDILIQVSSGCAFIPTHDGSDRVEVGDYIIKEVGGKLTPCKPDIFEATYDLVLVWPDPEPMRCLIDPELYTSHTQQKESER